MTLAETHTRMPLNRRGSPPHLASHIAHRTSRTRAPADGQEETVNQIVILTARGLRLESAVLVRSAVLRRLVRDGDGDGARIPSLLRASLPISESHAQRALRRVPTPDAPDDLLGSGCSRERRSGYDVPGDAGSGARVPMSPLSDVTGTRTFDGLVVASDSDATTTFASPAALALA